MRTPQRVSPLLFFPGIGNRTIRLVNNLGAMAIFFFLAFINIFRRRQFREIVNQVYYIGATSSLIVLLVGLFTGMVLGLQLFYTLVKFGSVGALGTAVSLSLIREMGPVLTAIMITARAGSGITAEVGILRMSEQVDALYTMGVDPVRYLISPRVAASIISFPLLTAFFDLIGIIGGYITGVLLINLCRAEDIGLEPYLECFDESSEECAFLLSYANVRFCDCPFCLYIAKRLKK
jgi:phospholipid/cholesterol/gamma-HCH transport system permease protein